MIPTRGERIALFLAGALALLVALTLYLPVFVNGLFSVVELWDGRIQWDTFSLDAYQELLDDDLIIEAVVNTIIVGAVSVFLGSVVATGLALFCHGRRALERGFIELLVYLPFFMPPIMTGLSLLIFLDGLGMSRGLPTIVVGHVIFTLAILYRIVSTRLETIPASLADAAADLGATRWQTLRYVTLPLLAPAIVTSAVLGLALSFDETLVSVFLAGDETTLPLRLWAMMRVGFAAKINALVTLFLMVTMIMTIWAARRLGTALGGAH